MRGTSHARQDGLRDSAVCGQALLPDRQAGQAAQVDTGAPGGEQMQPLHRGGGAGGCNYAFGKSESIYAVGKSDSIYAVGKSESIYAVGKSESIYAVGKSESIYASPFSQKIVIGS